MSFDLRRAPAENEKKKPLHEGRLERLIDDLLCPLFDSNPSLIATDVMLHGLVEQNPFVIVQKFIRYTLLKIAKGKS